MVSPTWMRQIYSNSPLKLKSYGRFLGRPLVGLVLPTYIKRPSCWFKKLQGNSEKTAGHCLVPRVLRIVKVFTVIQPQGMLKESGWYVTSICLCTVLFGYTML